MNHTIQHSRAGARALGLVAAVLLATISIGCELIFSPDRSKIGTTYCYECACMQTSSEGSCEETCSAATPGTGAPSFCSGGDASSACAACIAQTCGESDPAACR